MNEHNFVDANIFLRALLPKTTSQHDECVAFLDAVRRGEISAVTSPVVLAEVVWVSMKTYKIPKREAIDGLHWIVNLRYLKIQDQSDVHTAAQAYAAHNVTFIDALIASNPAIQNGTMAVISYDKDFDTLGVRRIEPRAALKKKGE